MCVSFAGPESISIVELTSDTSCIFLKLVPPSQNNGVITKYMVNDFHISVLFILTLFYIKVVIETNTSLFN